MKTTKRTGWALGLATMAAIGLLGLGCQGEEDAADVDRQELPLAVERLASDLSLDSAQRAHLEAVHAMIEEHRDAHRAEREAHYQELRTMVETGEVSSEEVHARIDGKIDEVRGLAHRAADELIALVQSLSPDQRARAVDRLDRFHDRMVAFHDRVEAEGGPRAFFARLRGHGCEGPASWLDE